MPIYTRTGDKGQSSLYNGQRLPKTDSTFDLLGQIDQLNATIGICCSLAKNTKLVTEWEEIQKKLFAIGAEIAKADQIRNQVTAADITYLETQIDQYMERAGKLTSFILPGGSPLGAQAHYARTVIRNVERAYLKIEEPPSNQNISIYLNRLSDYFFAAARLVNKEDGCKETPWI